MAAVDGTEGVINSTTLREQLNHGFARVADPQSSIDAPPIAPSESPINTQGEPMSWNHVALLQNLHAAYGVPLPWHILQQQPPLPAPWIGLPQVQAALIGANTANISEVPLLQPPQYSVGFTAAAPSPSFESPKRTARKKRARILREGQLTMIVYGANEALTWARRVAHFQSAMRGVLGDRRRIFTWSGSVTDSVVGAFLTQNVSDALSSKAYMEVASRWPARTTNNTCRGSGGRLSDVEDTADWEAVRTVAHDELAETIKCRGMHTVLSGNIQVFLNYLRGYNLQKKAPQWAGLGASNDVMALIDGMISAVEGYEDRSDDCTTAMEVEAAMEEVLAAVEEENKEESPAQRPQRASKQRAHVNLAYEESPKSASEGQELEDIFQAQTTAASARLLSLEWLRDVPDDEAREFLMAVNGLGRKSVACIMLLTLGKKEFPVDTNVGRICSRLGWIPLDAAEAIEDLDDYAPEPEVHAYLRSRLLGFDIETLYELHYQMITLGKVFCSKNNPNCDACPMRGDCEYARNNGPSLHGRKRARTAADISVAGMVVAPQQSSWPTPETARLAPKSPGMKAGPKEKGVHWRTLQKMERLAKEQEALALAQLEHALKYSMIPLEDLVQARSTRPRSQGLRRPRGTAADPVPLLQRAEAELTALDAALSSQRPYPTNWLPLNIMHLEEQGEVLPQSVWDLPDTGEDEGAAPSSQQAAVWERELAEAPAVLQPLGNTTHPGKVREESMLWLSSLHEMPAVWDLAHLPPPQPLAAILEEQLGPPLILKAKPMVESINSLEQQGVEMIAPSPEPMREGRSPSISLAAEDPRTPPAAPLAVPEVTTEAMAPLELIPEESMMEIDTSAANGLNPSSSVFEIPATTPIDTLPQLVVTSSVIEISQPEDSLPEEATTYAPDEPSLTTYEACALSSGERVDVEAECTRLRQLSSALADVNEVISTLEEGFDNSHHRKKLLELSLQALNIDLTLTVDSADAVVAMGRKNYRHLARALHPDKCNHPGAVDAFSALAMAMDIVADYACTAGAGMKNNSNGEGTNNSAAAVEHSMIWNQHRLVVAGSVLPANVFDQFPHLSPDGTEIKDEQVLFLPLDEIPTFQRERFAGRFDPGGGTTQNNGDYVVRGVVERLLDAVCRENGAEIVTERPGSEEESGSEVVEGMLLMTCRAALRGRFPLNGTYFQINEVFVDHSTAMEPVKLLRSDLVDAKSCTVYFGLGIHYMAKGMSQEEVSLMFSDGWVCFRAFNPETRAPMLLPTSLMPSVPTNSKSTWKNKDERAAIRAAKVAARAAKAQLDGGTTLDRQLPSPEAALPNITPFSSPIGAESFGMSQMRLVRAPLGSGEVVAPPPAPQLGAAPQYPSVGIALPLGTPPASVIPRTPPGTTKKKPQVTSPAWASPIAHAEPGRPGQPKTQEAFDAKSGRGQHRRRSYGPVIPASQRCGSCKPCLNPGWKKPCEVRRAEALRAQHMAKHMAQHALLMQQSVGYYGAVATSPSPPTMQTPESNGNTSAGVVSQGQMLPAPHHFSNASPPPPLPNS